MENAGHGRDRRPLKSRRPRPELERGAGEAFYRDTTSRRAASEPPPRATNW